MRSDADLRPSNMMCSCKPQSCEKADALSLCVRAGERSTAARSKAVQEVSARASLAIEGSLHEIDGLDVDDPKLPVLRSLGLDKDLAFVDVGDLYEVRGRQIGAPFALPYGMERALRATVERFPHQSEALAEYFRRLAATRDAVSFAAKHQDDSGFWLRHAPEAVRRLWPLLREGRATVAEVLDDLFGADETVKLALAGNLGYFHDDPARMSFVRFAIPQASYLLGGGHYIRGGSRALSGRLVGLIEQAEGVVETGRDVFDLVLGGECVIGAAHYRRGHTDPRVDYAPVIFGNAAPQRLAELLPESRREAFLAPYANRRPSISLWTLSLGLSRPPAEFGVRSYSTFMLPPWIRALAALRDAGHVPGEDAGRLPPYVFVDYSRSTAGSIRPASIWARFVASTGSKIGGIFPPRPSRLARPCGWSA